MHQTIAKTADSFISWGITALAFLLPLFFLPITSNFFDYNKQVLLFFITSLLLVTWIIKLIYQKTLSLSFVPLTLPFTLLVAATGFSVLLQSSNQLETFMGKPATLITLLLLFLIATNNIHNFTQIRRHLLGLVTSAVILSLIAIYQFFGLSSLPGPSFTPAGSSLGLLSLLLPLLPLVIYQAAITKTNHLAQKITWAVSGLLIATAISITIFLILPGKPNSPILLPYSVSWHITLQSLRSIRPILLGLGPDNFIQAFSLHRPKTFNLHQNWNIRFASASNEPLEILVTTGLLGLIPWMLIILTFLKYFLHPINIEDHKPFYFSLNLAILTSFIIHLLIPANFILLTSFLLLLTIWSCFLKINDPLTNHKHFTLSHSLLPVLTGLPIIGGLLLAWLVIITPAYSAELNFKHSLDALTTNQGTQTYNFQIEAINQNPHSTRYHRAYAATNLALANSLSQSKPDLSTPDRQNITQLIQQAIREAKIATNLNPQDPSNWEVLASVYRNLINVAQGADNWTIVAYSQAIKADPLSPRLRLELGGVYYAIGRYDDAVHAFQQAIDLKPNWANAHYNLAAAYKEKGDLDSATAQLQAVLGLVNPASADFQKASQDLETLFKPQPTASPHPRFTNITLPESASPGSQLSF